jgi:hypothetical protein
VPGTSVKPRRITVHSTELATDVRRGIGFSAYCACGWEGPLVKYHALARDDARAHRAEHAASAHVLGEHPEPPAKV